MKDAKRPLKRAIYARLQGGLKALDQSIVEIGNHIDEDTAMPYVVIGESTAIDISAHGEPGQEVTVTLHIWSDYQGDEEADSICDQIEQALTIVPLAVTGFSVPQSALDYSDVMIDPTGTARHGTLRWRAQLYEAKQ